MLASIGEKAVGAVGLCAQFSSLMFAGYWGFVGGGMLFFAQYWGAKDDDGITRSYGMTLLFMMTVGARLRRLSPSVRRSLSWASTRTRRRSRPSGFPICGSSALPIRSRSWPWPCQRPAPLHRTGADSALRRHRLRRGKLLSSTIFSSLENADCRRWALPAPLWEPFSQAS